MKHLNRALSLFLCFCLLIPLALCLFSCSNEPATENRVTSVTVEKQKIRIEANLTQGFLDEYTEKKVYLFELPSYYSTDADLSELDPVAEAKPRGTVRFTLPLLDGVRSRLHSSYLVAAQNTQTGIYTPLTAPMALTDLGDLKEEESSAQADEASLKGLISNHPSDAIRLGISHTVVEVPMEKLILASWQENSVSYIYNGVTRYLNAEALSELDETVNVYTAAGVQVYLRFRLGDPTNTDVPMGLYFPDASASGAHGFAVNMTTAFSSLIVEGFFDFMAERYASCEEGKRPVEAFILGYRVNHPTEYSHAGSLDLAAYVTNYEKLVRVAHNSLLSHNPAGRVYIALNDRRTVTDGEGWDVSAFLSAFRDEATLRGSFDWHLACEMYGDTSAIWEENAAADMAYYTARNLNTLTDLLDAERYRTATGASRRLLISGFDIPAVPVGGTASSEADRMQAASYAYAYMTCVQNGQVEALIYSTHVDSAFTAEKASLRGLWTVQSAKDLTEGESDISLCPAAARPIYNVFQKIDTTAAADLSSELTAAIGASYTKLESALAGKTPPVTIVNGTGVLADYDAEHKKASPLYTFGNGTLHGFTGAGNLTYLELTAAETLGTNTLYARFDRTAVCEPMGLTVTFPASRLIGGKELFLDLHAGPLASQSTSVAPTVTLRLTRKAIGSAADGKGEILYEASVTNVQSKSWQTATFDISSFTSRLDASDEVTLTLLMDYPAESAPKGSTAHNLALAGIHVTGITATSGPSSGLVIGIIVAIVILVAALFVFLFRRNRY
jgi:hypothetical protein